MMKHRQGRRNRHRKHKARTQVNKLTFLTNQAFLIHKKWCADQDAYHNSRHEATTLIGGPCDGQVAQVPKLGNGNHTQVMGKMSVDLAGQQQSWNTYTYARKIMAMGGPWLEFGTRRNPDYTEWSEWHYQSSMV
jgi:hypothetical protein